MTAGQNENNYSFFSASGMDFIIINLTYSPDATVLIGRKGCSQRTATAGRLLSSITFSTSITPGITRHPSMP